MTKINDWILETIIHLLFLTQWNRKIEETNQNDRNKWLTFENSRLFILCNTEKCNYRKDKVKVTAISGWMFSIIVHLVFLIRINVKMEDINPCDRNK